MKWSFEIFVLFLCLNFWACNQKTDPAQATLDAKMAPSDFLSQRYAYPDVIPNWKGYQKVVSDVRTARQSSKSIPGFDAPWRLEGPGNIGARINTIAAHPTNADIILIGYSHGGIFKTTNGGNSWNPVFDQSDFLSVSALVYDPTDDNIMYAGTGDHNISGFPFVGNGIYKSNDAGDSWTHMGLAPTGIISRIVVAPDNSNIVYAAAMGKPFAPDSDRGLYKSSDGGQNWTQVLYLGDSTGVVDVVMHPTNSNILLAAGWDRIRNNSTSLISGQGAKIWKTTDGGATWNILTTGLPQDDQSRIGLTASVQNPGRFYAEYVGTELTVQGIYETTNSGDSWTPKALNNLALNSGGFAWYFGQIRARPNNDQVLYHCSISLWRSLDGGDNWSRLTNSGEPNPPHVDMHDVQIDADGSILLASDGGLYKQLAGEQDWIDMENIPTTQFYRVTADPFNPGTYFGGAQDNGTTRGDFTMINNWERIFGGDGFSIVFNPDDANVSYVETQNGNVYRSTNGGQTYLYFSNGFDPLEFRPWDMFLMLDPFNSDIVYSGGQKLYKSEVGISNDEFVAFSDNLTETATSTSEDRYHFITHIAASSFEQDLLYVGTSDGLVWKKKSAVDWELINTGLPDRYVTRVITSALNNDRLFVTHSGYKDGDNSPHIHMSINQGNSWTDISGDLPAVGINDLIVLPNSGDSTLMVGTDMGVFGSYDQGVHWEFVGIDMPSIPVYDMDLDMGNNRLVASTFGRSIFSYDLMEFDNGGAITLAGQVKSGAGLPVNNVELVADNSSQQTGPDGTFNLSLIPAANCNLTPSKTGPNNNGVTITDIVLLQRHVVLLDTLTLLGQFAGDVNQDERLTINDVLRLQRSVILVDTVFPAGSWGFVPEQFVFTDSTDAFTNPIPQELSCTDAVSNPNFWAVKMGDVSGNANVQNLQEGSPRSALLLNKENVDGNTRIKFADQIELYGFQMKWEKKNTKRLEIIDQIPGLMVEQQGKEITLLWVSATGESMPMDKAIISFAGTVELQASTSNFLQEAITNINDQWGISEVLLEEHMESIPSALSIQIFPNPTSEYVNILFDSPQNGNWQIHSLQGALVKSSDFTDQMAVNINLDKSLAAGLYLLTVNTRAGSATEKIQYRP